MKIFSNTMSSTLTSKGQITIPKHIRDALGLNPGSQVDFVLHDNGDIVLRKAGNVLRSSPDRFEAARGRADVPWRTADLMKLLRGDEH